jgi:L-threonylcarbamoyladenylate synthase
MPARAATEPGFWQLKLAVQTLRRGGIVLHATEGVWGLACDPMQRRAVARLLRLKRRSPMQGLILIGAGADSFNTELSALPPAQQQKVSASWPGPVTWLLPSQRFPSWITGSRPRVAVRVPGHCQARALCAAFGAPLVSTSANLSGRPAARNSWQARTFYTRTRGISYMLPGNTAGLAGPSEIRELDGQVLRAG